jgi:hypothetical protein
MCTIDNENVLEIKQFVYVNCHHYYFYQQNSLYVHNDNLQIKQSVYVFNT